MPDIVYLAELKPALAAGGAEQTIRLSSNPAWTRANGVDWLPVLAVPFRRNLQVFDGQFQSNPEDFGSLEFAKDASHSAAPLTDMVWDGRAVKIWKGVVGQATAAMTVVFDGEAEKIQGDRARFAVTLRGPNIEVPLLALAYAGTGLAEGGADLKNVPKPMLLGTAMNLEPKYVNKALGIFQYHGYGAAGGCSAVYDSGSQLGTSIGDYATYAALAAAVVPAGRFATCNALGMGRHGGEITGILTIDAAGAVSGGLPGAIIKWILRTHLGLAAGKVKEDSLDWLDGQIAYPQDVYVTEQTTAQEFIAGFMLSLGGYLHFLDDGRITVGLVRRGAAASITLNRQNIAVGLKVQPTSPPVWKRNQGYQRSWRTHTYAEVRTPKEINPRGTWSASPTPVYQYYDLVDYGAASYVYVASAAGNTAIPGTDPLVWQLFRQNGAPIVDSATTPTDPVPGLLWRNSTNGQLRAYIAGTWVLTSDVTGQNIASGITGQGALATANSVDWRTQVAQRPAIGELYYDFNYANRAAYTAAGWITTPNDTHADIVANGYSPGGKALQLGTGTGGGGLAQSVTAFGPEWVPYNYADLYEVAFDLEVLSADASTVIYLGVEATDRAGNNLGGSYNYVASSGESQTSRVGQRFIRKGYFTGLTTALAGVQANDALSPSGLPDGSAAGFGQGAAVRFRPIALVNYPNKKGQVLIHAMRVTRIPARMAVQDEVAFGTVLIKETTGGTQATLSNFKTILGISSGITGQGALATLNAADWNTRVVGSGKPANNATANLTLYAEPSAPNQYIIYGNQIEKVGGSGWNSCVFSRESFVSGCVITGRFSQTNAYMFGLIETPGAGDYNILKWAWYNNYGGAISGIYESGNGRGAFGGAYASTDVFSIVYDDADIVYYKNAVEMRRVAVGAGKRFYAVMIINPSTAVLDGPSFGPYSTAANDYISTNKWTVVGAGSEMIGNTLRKIGGTHGSWDGGIIGTAQLRTCFVSSSVLFESTGGGGWKTTLALDPGTSAAAPDALIDGAFYCVYTADTTTTGDLKIYKRVSGSTVLLGSFGIGGASSDRRRMALIFNGRRVFVMIDGNVYGGNTSSYDAPSGMSFYPRIFDYHRSDTLINVGMQAIVDIRYGTWSDARTWLDDGYTVLNQAGFKTDEGISTGIIGQGPGATAPADDVLNYSNASAVTIVRAPGGGMYSYDTEPVIGAIKISLPVGYTNTMVRFAVDIYNYQGGPQETYIVSGYAYAAVSSTNGYWIYVSANYIGPENRSRRVRFGHDGTKACVWIGETSDSRSYPKVVIRDLMAGYSNQSASIWKAGWAVTTSTTAPSNGSQAILEVAKPRAGDAVFGEGIYESAGGATAALTNFKTALGVAASVLGQGALATKNNVDLSTTQVLPRGSIPSSLPNNGFTYTSTVSTVTVSWASMTVYRADGTTISVASGSQAITGLGASTTYRIYPYILDTGSGSETMAFVTGVGTVFGSPQILYSNSSPNVAAAAQMYLYTRIPMGNFQVATPASGGGGGGGGGWNCLHQDMLLGNKAASELVSGLDMIATPEGYVMVDALEHHTCSRWIELWSEGELVAKVTERHLFYRAIDGKEVPAADLVLGDILKAEGDHVQITGLSLCTKAATAVGISIADPHLHYAGPRQLLCHNGTAKP